MKFVVYSHINRISYGQKLRDAIGGDCILHTDFGSGHLNVVLNCLEQYQNITDDYLILCEDDIVLCERFIESVNSALKANVNNYPVVFFSMSSEIIDADKQGYRWIKSNNTAWAQCVAYPKHIIPGILKYPRENIKFSDVLLSMYCLENKIPIYQPIPNFVQHMELKSTIGNPVSVGGRTRTTKLFGSGIGVDYSIGYEIPYNSKIRRSISLYKKAYKIK